MPEEIPIAGIVPTPAMDGAFGHIDKLYAIIDRADDRLADIDCHQVAIDLGVLGEAGLELADRLILALNAVLDARAILAEATPPDEEGEDDA